MISELRFRMMKGRELNPQRWYADLERSVMPVFVEPEKSLIWGLDTSHWDGNVDYEPAAEAGAKFAFIKCMDGGLETPYFRSNFVRAKAAGLLSSGYAWLYADWAISVKLQAQRVFELTGGLGMTMPLVIDFETTRYAGQNANPDYDDLRRWAEEYNRLSGKKAILYSAAWYMNPFGAMPADLRELFAGFWWASYGGAYPTFPMGFSTWDVWQFTATADALKYAPGDKGKRELDLNYMTPEFYKQLGGVVTEPAPGGNNMKYQVIWSQGVSRRTRPSTSDSYTGLVYPYGTIAEVIEDGIPDATEPSNPDKVWVKFADGYYGASMYPNSAGVPSIRMAKVNEPEPTPGKKLVKGVLYYDDGTSEDLYPEA